MKNWQFWEVLSARWKSEKKKKSIDILISVMGNEFKLIVFLNCPLDGRVKRGKKSDGILKSEMTLRLSWSQKWNQVKDGNREWLVIRENPKKRVCEDSWVEHPWNRVCEDLRVVEKLRGYSTLRCCQSQKERQML